MAVGDAQRSALVIPAVDENGALITGAPVLLMFHGFIGNAEKIVERTNLAAFTSAHGVHLVAPQGIGALATWHLLSNEVDDSAFIDVLMDELSSSPCVDPDRIGLAGFSAGSAWTGVYACTHADRLALVLMASGLPGNLCSPDADLDIIIAHGTADPVVPFEGGGQEVDGTVVELDTVSESARNWAAGAGCETEPDVETVPDGVTTLTIWTDCGADSVVMFEVVEGMAHSWTGADADGGTLNAGCLAVVRLVGDTEALSQCHP